jgi:hypothetical protein
MGEEQFLDNIVKEKTMKRAFWVLLAFGLVLAACATTGGSGAPPLPEAEQLAADLTSPEVEQLVADLNNAAKNGGTVTLRSGTEVRKNLTVPVGVTLEITEDGGLWLMDVILTVNGTVNTPSNKFGISGNALSATINGSGTIKLLSKGQLLGIDGANKKLTLDGVTLIGIADNDSQLVWVGNGGELILKSGAITGNTRIVTQWNGGGGVLVNGEGTTFTMEGGEISGNNATGDTTHGGGVRVENSGAFTMKGGKISGNSANGSVGANGGGVAVLEDSVFTMEGGEIFGNSATGKGSCGASGVLVMGTFTMSGGIISGNNVSGGQAKGGGVNVLGGIFTMLGGTISGNSTSGSVLTFGGGVGVSSTLKKVGGFIMLGGTIYGSASVANAGDNANETRDGSGAPVTGDRGGLAARGAAIWVDNWGDPIAKWGTGGAYTKGGAAQTGGSDIGNSDSTLIAIPAR